MYVWAMTWAFTPITPPSPPPLSLSRCVSLLAVPLCRHLMAGVRVNSELWSPAEEKCALHNTSSLSQVIMSFIWETHTATLTSDIQPP